MCTELMDGVIRILDVLGREIAKEDGDFEMTDATDDGRPVRLAYLYEAGDGVSEENLREAREMPLPELITQLHAMTSAAWQSGRKARLAEAMMLACIWISGQGIMPEELLAEKHEYNKSRPYRHGGKKC